MTNDLISREALKTELGEQMVNISKVSDFIVFAKLIDNAPAVKPSFSIKDITEEEKQNFILLLQRATGKGLFFVESERPQGEWIYKKFDVKSGISHSYWCSNCGEPKCQCCDNFCQMCGADMRGGIK